MYIVMKSCSAFAFGLLVAHVAVRSSAAELLHQDIHVSISKQKRLLLSDRVDISSPDVALHGACAADIVLHCKHLIAKEWTKFALSLPKTSLLAQELDVKAFRKAVTQSIGGLAAVQGDASASSKATTVAVAQIDASTANKQAAKNDGAQTSKPRGVADADTAAQAAGSTAASSVARAADDKGSAAAGAQGAVAVAGRAVSSGAASTTDAADKAGVAAGTGAGAGAAGPGATSAVPAASAQTAQQTDPGKGQGQGAAGTGSASAGGAAAGGGQTAKTAAAGQTASGPGDATSKAAAAAAAASAGTDKGGVVEGAAGMDTTAAAAGSAAANSAAAGATVAVGTAAEAAAGGTGKVVAEEGTDSTAAAKAEDGAAASAEKAAAMVVTPATTAGSGAAGAEQQQRRRQLLAHGDLSSLAGATHGRSLAAAQKALAAKAVLAELTAVTAHQDDLSQALEQLGLASGGLSAAMMAAATAPITRCLQGVMHASEMSINPLIPGVADECKAEVRSVMIRRAEDVRYDPPLLAACSHDIVTHCAAIGADTKAVLGCLKSVKPKLLPLCRVAVTVRQAAAAEDLSLDPDLQRSCGAERDELCIEAGWGGGEAQSCLLGHLRGSLPQVFSELLFPASGAPVIAVEDSDSVAKVVELSANCSAALVQRLIEEGEDIRFNFKLSSACAGDKQVLCRDVKPGGAAVLGCLEDHLDSPNMQEECREALFEARQLRSLDVRLDHTFMSSCGADVRNLCGDEVAALLEASPAEAPFGQAGPFECLRGRLDQVRDATCRRHMYEAVIAAYNDNRLDAGLMRGCHQETAVLCSQHPARALECLQDKIDKFSRDDSPAVLRGKFSDACLAVVLERRQQAATDVAFLPDLMAACAREHATLCAAQGLEGVRALDCLADHRNSPDFSDRCGTAMRDYLAEASRDIRTMAGLQQDCGQEIRELCRGILPGEGRVISCLRNNRANITGEMCRLQVMRLLGFMVEDHRLDARLVQACTGDVQKYCGGVEVGGGQVHDCLRRSFDHLSPECRSAEEEVERLEHEDVRLNPRLMRECPLAIRSFCGDVPPGDARVIRCLQSNMDKGHFPVNCRTALLQLTDRAAVKYSLNYRLRQECAEDEERLCPEAVDELGASRKSVTGTGPSHTEETTLACLARQSGDLAPSCRAELQALVKLSLNRYRVGMPLTSQCDGDVMQRCQVDQMAAPFLQSGYVLSCLAKHAAKLHKPCWELVSTMDEGQFKRAAVAETSHWQSAGGAMVDDKVLKQVAADVRRELEPRLYNSVHEQINRKTVQVARNMTGALVLSIAPKVNALMHTTLSLLMLTGVGLLGALLAWRKFMTRGGSVLVVRKDGRV